MVMAGLTPRQADALRFISGFIEANGYSPTRREIMAGIGNAGPASVQRLTEALEERGAIRTLRYRDRSIEVLRSIAMPRAPDGTPLYAVPIGEAF